MNKLMVIVIARKHFATHEKMMKKSKTKNFNLISCYDCANQLLLL